MYTLLPLVIIVIAFWFLLIRPQQKRQAQLRALQSELTPGDRVMLSSGIFGTVTGTVDDGVMVQIADGVTVKVVRNAIGHVLPPDEAEPTEESDIESSDGVDLSKPEES